MLYLVYYSLTYPILINIPIYFQLLLQYKYAMVEMSKSVNNKI